MPELEGKVVVVTGALGTLGRRHALAVAMAGADVVLADLDEPACGDLAITVSHASGRNAIGVGVDVTSQPSVDALRDRVLDVLGTIDGVVHDAALNDRVEDPSRAAACGDLDAYPVDLFRKMLDVNVTGTFLVSRALGGTMARRGRGSIVTVGSTYALVAPDQSLYRDADGRQQFYKSAAYPASKGAVVSLTRHLASWWAGAGVRVNCLVPGGVENGQSSDFAARYARRTPLGRMAKPDDYDGAVRFLLSDASRYMTGATLVVDGGWTAW